MKHLNSFDEMIRYGDPLMSGRRTRRGYAPINYNAHYPTITAMNAHLRASAYRDKEDKKTRPTAGLMKTPFPRPGAGSARQKAILFGLVVTMSIWNIIYAVQAIAARLWQKSARLLRLRRICDRADQEACAY